MKRETMSDGFDAAPYDKEIPAEIAADDTSKEAAEGVYQMFCELDAEEQAECFRMIEKKHRDVTKKPARASDDREFQPMGKEDR